MRDEIHQRVREKIEKLEKIREVHDFTQEEMARKLDVSRTTYNNWKTSKTFPDWENIEKMDRLIERIREV